MLRQLGLDAQFFRGLTRLSKPQHCPVLFDGVGAVLNADRGPDAFRDLNWGRLTEGFFQAVVINQVAAPPLPSWFRPFMPQHQRVPSCFTAAPCPPPQEVGEQSEFMLAQTTSSMILTGTV